MSELSSASDGARLTRAMLEALDAAGLREDAAAIVYDFGSHLSAEWRADEDIYPASIIKLALMTQAYQGFSDGSLSPEARAVITRANLTPTAEPTPLVEGYAATLAELVGLMITRSDNVATNQLIDVLQRDRISTAMRALGLRRFHLGRKVSGADPLVDDPASGERNSMRPSEAAHLLRLIATDAVPGAAQQRELLARCVDDGKLVPGLQPGDRFMHKTGATSVVDHDAGILRTAQGREYVVVLYTTHERMALDQANASMAAWMRRMRPVL